MPSQNITQKIDEFSRTLDSAATSQAEQIALKALHLASILVRKNRGYGNSVFDSPVMLPDMPPVEAIKVRMSDKITRIRNLSQKAEGQVDFESLSDSYLDLAGYSVLAACLLDLMTIKPFEPEAIRGEHPLRERSPDGLPATSQFTREDFAIWIASLERDPATIKTKDTESQAHDCPQGYREGWEDAFGHLISVLLPNHKP